MQTNTDCQQGLHWTDMPEEVLDRILQTNSDFQDLFRYTAINHTTREIALELLVRKAPDHPKLLLLAVQLGHLTATDRILTLHPELAPTTNIFEKTALHIAAAYGHTRIVHYLLENHNCDIDGLDDCQETPLLAAAKAGHTNVLKTLVRDGGAKVDARGYESSTALHVAAATNDAATLRCLLSHGAEPLVYDDFNDTPLDLAVRNGCIQATQCLLRNSSFSCRQWRRVMDIAGYECNVEMVELLLDNLSDITLDSEELESISFPPYRTRSNVSEQERDTESPRSVIGTPKVGAIPFRNNSSRGTITIEEAIQDGLKVSLFSAMYTGTYDPEKLDAALQVMRCLFDFGVDVNSKDWLGTTPLMRVAAAKPETAGLAMAAVLLEAGAVVEEVRDELGVSVVEHAVSVGNWTLAEMLVLRSMCDRLDLIAAI